MPMQKIINNKDIKMERCANTEAMDKYLEQQNQEEREYSYMLEDLRNAEPDQYEAIIDEYGYSHIDPLNIIEDM